MAIQFRRGQHNKFDKTKMLAGEPAVVLGGDPDTADGKALYIAFAQGDATRMARADEIPGEASQSAAGLMSAGDKAKLDGVAVGANAYVHPSYTARTGKPTGNQTPAFGGTFPVSQIVTDAQGHVTAATDRTVRIPDTEASQGAHGLMSAADKKALDAIKVTSGNRLHRAITAPVVTASDAYAAPPVALVVDGKSVQDGTPTPEAPVPIESVGSVSFGTSGKNLMRTDVYANTSGYYPSAAWVDHTIGGITWTRNEDGSVTANGTATGNSSCYFPIVHKIPAGTTIAMSGCPSGASGSTYRMLMCSTDNSNLTMVNDDGGTGKVATITKAANRVRVMVFSGATVSNLTFRPQVTIGGTVLPYMPHVGAITPIDLQGHELRSLPDGTHDELRVDADGNVTLVQRVGTVTYDGSSDENWKLNNAGIAASIALPTIRTPENNSVAAPLMSNLYVAGAMSAVNSGTVGIACSVTKNLEICPTGSAITLDWVRSQLAANPMETHYPLVTPQEISLGTVSLPALPAPDLTAWARCTPATDIELDYERDVNIALAAAESVAATSLAPADGPTATASHAAGSLLTLGGQLVKATRAIVAGEQIAIGTNVAVTTVAAELAALA